jgi:hypothetical protein
MATRYYKSTVWLKQFVDLCSDILPIDRILTIKEVRVPLDKRIATDAQLKWDTSGWYEITMNMHSHEYENLGNQHFKKVSHRKDSLGNVLDSLAHELAHIKYKEHVPNHLILQCKILIRFAKHLKKLGVRDTSKPYNKEIKHDT